MRFLICLLFATMGCSGPGDPPPQPVPDADADTDADTDTADTWDTATPLTAPTDTASDTGVTDTGVTDTGVTDTAVSPAPVQVAWSNEQTTPGCFTFSSPTLLGADAMYTDGALATLDFTAPYWAAEFTGTWIGPDLALESVEIFPYFGTDYQVTERLTGVLVGDVLSGTYRYVECDLTNAPWSCPADGICEVRADFSVTLP